MLEEHDFFRIHAYSVEGFVVTISTIFIVVVEEPCFIIIYVTGLNTHRNNKINEMSTMEYTLKGIYM